MSENNKYSVQDLILHAVEQKPLEFNDTFAGLMIDRIRDAVEAKKVSIAKTFFNYDGETQKQETVPEEQ